MRPREKKAQLTPHSYRPEIDGLRAVAVIAVIFFHLDSDLFSGGFVGVDVFFVISGYLITSFVRRSAVRGEFSYRRFFVRRVRRLMPVLLFVVTVVFLVSALLLQPSDLVSLAKSVIAQPIALQNMHFLGEGEYFVGADAKPLLHTWSLGVEEQFYLVWPFVILLASRLSRRGALFFLATLLVASFGLNLALPIVSPKASFFLFPARAWEMGVGGMLSVWQEKQIGKARKWEGGLLVGALGVLLGCFVWISAVGFPGFPVLIPVFATVVLIWGTTASGDPWVKRVLSSRPLVLIGLVSYSLYLWHWPLIVFAKKLDLLQEWWGGVMVVVLSITLATLSYWFVEQPVRRGRILSSTGKLIAGMLIAAGALVLAAVISIKTDGLAFRYDEPARSMLTAYFDVEGDERCGLLFRATHPTAQVCQMNDSEARDGGGLLLWGNSHAAMWVGVISDLGDEQEVPVYMNARNCRPTTDSAFCDDNVQDEIFSFIEETGIETVVLAATWFGAYGIDDDTFSEQLDDVVTRLDNTGVAVWLVLDVPHQTALDPVARYSLNPDHPSYGRFPIAEHHQERNLRETAYFEELCLGGSNVNMLDPTPDLCFDGFCYGGDETAWFRDDEHVTASGAARSVDLFRQVFE